MRLTDKFNEHINNVMKEIEDLYLNEGQVFNAVDLIREYKRVVICSMGKPAFACAKAVYTAHSFGLDWVELDATHAFHGDMGVLKDGDLVIIVSKSGETDETNDVAAELQCRGFMTLGITSEGDSRLGRLCSYILEIPIDGEHSPFGHSPMASTTLYMIVLHALLCEAVEANNVTIEDFKRNHPAGQIGERLNEKSGS